ncbi:hypothetical protein B0H16DRAFT_1348515, partial [Mycena metata]
IVHGDLKPQNLLICSDGRVRLCDFDNASIEGDGFVASEATFPYCSTVRARNVDDPLPMTRAEDLHAMGLSIWHIYTGRIPLTDGFDLDERDIGNRTLAGFLPDMALIDDPDIASLIEGCIAAGPYRPYTEDNGQAIYCITTRFVFERCQAEPVHTYSTIDHGGYCLDRMDRGDGPCEFPFMDPKVFTTE